MRDLTQRSRQVSPSLYKSTGWAQRILIHPFLHSKAFKTTQTMSSITKKKNASLFATHESICFHVGMNSEWIAKHQNGNLTAWPELNLLWEKNGWMEWVDVILEIAIGVWDFYITQSGFSIFRSNQWWMKLFLIGKIVDIMKF